MSLLTGRWAGAAATAVFVVAALAVGRAVGSELPQAFDRLGAVRDHRVAVGETAYLRTAEITVTDVHLGTTLDDWQAPLTTPGLWVVADVELTPTDEDAGLADWQVVGEDGTSWGRTRPLVDTCRRVPPGVPQRCAVVVEVPPEALPGAVLHLTTELDVRYDDRAVVELGLTADDVARGGEVVEPLVPRPFEMGVAP